MNQNVFEGLATEAHGLLELFYSFAKVWSAPGGLFVVHCALSPDLQIK